MRIELFDAAVAQLKAASNGLYQGPMTSGAALQHALNATAGLDTQGIEAAARRVGGTSDPGQLRPMGPVLEAVLHEFAEAAIGVGLETLLRGVVRGHERNECVAQSTARAGQVISTIDQESSLMCDAALGTLSTAMQPLLAAIMAANPLLNPVVGPAMFPGLVKTAGGLIDAAASFIMGTCQTRDEAINECFDALISECEQAVAEPEACVHPAPTPPPPAVSTEPSSAPVVPDAAAATPQKQGPSIAPIAAQPATPSPVCPNSSLGQSPLQPASLGSSVAPSQSGVQGVLPAVEAIGDLMHQASKGVLPTLAAAAESALAPTEPAPNAALEEPLAPQNVDTQDTTIGRGFGLSIDIRADIDIDACEEASASQCEEQAPAEATPPYEETADETTVNQADPPPQEEIAAEPAPEVPTAEEAPVAPVPVEPEPVPEQEPELAQEVVCEPEPQPANPAVKAKKAGGWS